MRRILLLIKGLPQDAVDALNKRGIDSFDPVKSFPSFANVSSVTTVDAHLFEGRVFDWYHETINQAFPPFPVGTLLHYSLTSPTT